MKKFEKILLMLCFLICFCRPSQKNTNVLEYLIDSQHVSLSLVYILEKKKYGVIVASFVTIVQFFSARTTLLISFAQILADILLGQELNVIICIYICSECAYCKLKHM